MGVVRKRPAAKRDLIDQFEWYAENASLKIARGFLQAANATLAHLSEMPESGALVPVEQEQLIGLRRCPVSGFDKILLFYRPLRRGIDLVRVVHGSRDLKRLFEESFRDQE